MAENFVGEPKQEDLKALKNQIREHESIMRLKRRWLMDLPLSKREQKRIEELLPPNDKIMPESFLREDDVGYEDIRTCIEKAFGASNIQKKPSSVQEEDLRVFNSSCGFQEVSFLLDAMSNNGLCSFARILTGGFDEFDKTKWGMMRTISDLLPKVIADKSKISTEKLKKCSQLLRDPTNFRGEQALHFTASESYCAAASKVLEGLEDFSSRTLRAMRRKLNGEKGYVPLLQPPQYKQSHSSLVKVVRRKCMKMLSNIRGADEHTDELAGALGVAGLTLKLLMNRRDVREFRRFSPEIDALHNDIAKAIHLLKEPKKVSLIELRKLQLLLDPNAQLSTQSLRAAVRIFLIEYLYECSDMDSIPEFLIEALDIINRRAQVRSRRKCSSVSVGSSSGKELMKEEMVKEMEHVLNISAQAKELVANCLLEHEFDEEFAHAYLEVYDGSDNLCVYDDDDDVDDSQQFTFRSYSKYDKTEGTGETSPVELHVPVTNGRLLLSLDGKSDDPDKSNGSSDFEVGETDILHEQRGSINGYLKLQEACDASSMVAYRFVGYMLDSLAKAEGLELCESDRSYLHSHASIPDHTEELSGTTMSKFSEMWKNVEH